MRVLVACEFSGVVRDAFVRRGHYAMSCDLLPCESSHPGLHYQGDVRNVLDGWEPVRYTGECDPDGDGWCQLLDIDPGECQCLGPTQDNVEYKEVDGVLLGRMIDDQTGLPVGWDLMIGHPECTFLTVANNGPVTRGCSLYTAEQAAVYRQDAIDFRDNHVVTLYVESNERFSDYYRLPLPHITTRGQVLDLLRLLGKEVKP